VKQTNNMGPLNISTEFCLMISEIIEFLRSIQLQESLLVFGWKKSVFVFVRSRQIQQFLNASEYCPL